MNIKSTYKLLSGFEIPVLGFGVYKSPPEITSNSVQHALKSANVRHVDTAQFYQNEKQVGEAIRASGIPRKDVFVTTKIVQPAEDGDNYKKILESVEKIGLDYVDLFLIHSPHTGPKHRREIWKALEKLVKEKKAKSIGVSNYGVKHLEELKQYAELPITVNQIEIHPFNQMRDITDYCQSHGIIVEAYCPLIRAVKKDDPTLLKVAKEVNKDWSQVLLRWSIQKGFSPIYKSDTPSRITSNAEIFDFSLNDEQMKTLDSLDEGLHVAPNVVDCE